MRLHSRALFLVALVTTIAASSASAQRRTEAFAQGKDMLLGPQVGVGTSDFDFFIGAQFAYPIVNRLDIYPSFQYYFPGNNAHAWTIDGTVRYWPKLNIRNSGLYAGGGLNITHSSASATIPGIGKVSASSTDAGLSLLGGWQFRASNLFPYGQIRVVIGDADRVDFGGGVNFKL